jgi:hypothetical protein
MKERRLDEEPTKREADGHRGECVADLDRSRSPSRARDHERKPSHDRYERQRFTPSRLRRFSMRRRRDSLQRRCAFVDTLAHSVEPATHAFWRLLPIREVTDGRETNLANVHEASVRLRAGEFHTQ